MSILLFSKEPIILLSFTADEFYLHYHEILEKASMLSLLDYVTGKQSVPTQEEVNALDLSRMHFYEEQLMVQQKNEEDEMRSSLLEEIKLNPLKAYAYILPIISINPNRPTLQELRISRLIIPYHEFTYMSYLDHYNEGIYDLEDERRDQQYDSVRPSAAYIGYGSNNQANTDAAAHVQQIRPYQWKDLVDMEVSRHPSVQRLDNDDDIFSITAKLNHDNTTKANTAFNKCKKHYTTEKSRVDDLNSQLLKFFKETIEGLDNNPASTHIKNHHWNLVLSAIREYYGNMNAPNALDGMKLKFANLQFLATETVHQYVNKIRNLAANIQIVSEAIEKKVESLTYEQAFEACVLTHEEFVYLYPDHIPVQSHLTILQKLLVGMADTKLHQVQFNWNTQVRDETERTVVNLIKAMNVGEAALKVDNQAYHQVSNVSTGAKSSFPNVFCAFHSHGGNVSTHETKDCNIINAGKTKPDPSNSKFHVWKNNGEPFKPYSPTTTGSGGVKSGNKRSFNATNTNVTKPSGSIAKSCTACLKLNREGAFIPESVMKSHEAANCRVNPKRYNNPSAANSTATAKGATNSAFDKLTKAVNQITAAVAPIIKDYKQQSSKSKKVKIDEASDDEN